MDGRAFRGKGKVSMEQSRGSEGVCPQCDHSLRWLSMGPSKAIKSNLLKPLNSMNTYARNFKKKVHNVLI